MATVLLAKATNFRHLIVVFLGFSTFWAASISNAGVVRYHLPELLGKHVYDGSEKFYFAATTQIDTPFGYYSVKQARLVVVGTVTTGKARGDGVLREAIDFDLKPSVFAGATFANSAIYSNTSTPYVFRIDQVYPNPFVPNVTPLPNPDGYPPISFQVFLSVGISATSDFPPLLTPPLPGTVVFETDGLTIEAPIVANIVEVYVLMEGPEIVPEPAAGVLLVTGAAYSLRRRRLQAVRNLWPRWLS